jgi:hypothetical protein
VVNGECGGWILVKGRTRGGSAIFLKEFLFEILGSSLPSINAAKAPEIFTVKLLQMRSANAPAFCCF